MILDRYNYRYALLPIEAAKTIGLGWRKTDVNKMVMVNLSELKQLPGTGTIEEKVTALGGQIMTPEEALYYSKTNTFTLNKVEPTPEPAPQTEFPMQEILPPLEGGLQDGTQNQGGQTQQEVAPDLQGTAPEAKPDVAPQAPIDPAPVDPMPIDPQMGVKPTDKPIEGVTDNQTTIENKKV